MLCGWGDNENPVTGQVVADTNSTGSVTLLPYFEHNIVYNFNNGSDALAYTTHQRASEEENLANFRRWAVGGAPDVLLGWVDLEPIFGNEVTMQDYTVATKISQTFIWKADLIASQYSIYRRID